LEDWRAASLPLAGSRSVSLRLAERPSAFSLRLAEPPLVGSRSAEAQSGSSLLVAAPAATMPLAAAQSVSIQFLPFTRTPPRSTSFASISPGSQSLFHDYLPV